MAIGYLDVFCGLSGDLFLGTLIDCGLDPDDLKRGLQGLPVEGWDLRVAEVHKSGLRGTQVTVTAAEATLTTHDHHHGQAPAAPEHAHSHEFGHAHEPAHDHDHDHGAGHSHDHEHRHGHDHSHDQDERHHAHGRSADEIVHAIRHAQLPAEIIGRSVAVVERLAEAEAWCHGVPRSEVYFHELGGLDTIVDVVGGVLGLSLLGIEELYCSPLPVTHGYVNTAHGRLPVPVPAVAKLYEGVPTVGLDIAGETVTPTGAALAVVLAEVGHYPAMTIKRVGWGAGHKDFPVPNLLRLFIGEPAGAAPSLPSDTVVLLEANLDDMSPELYARAADLAFGAGAVDVWATPIQMKKNRPATMISALAAPEAADAVAAVLLRETTSFGVRRQLWQRQCLDRAHVTVATAAGDIRVKVGSWDGEVLTVAPEYGDCLAAAESAGMPLKVVYQQAIAAYHAGQTP